MSREYGYSHDSLIFSGPDSSGQHPRARNGSVRLVALLAGILMLVGCGRGTSSSENASSDSTKARAAASAPGSADEVLSAMIRAYQSASSYSDRAVLQVSFRDNGVPQADETSFAVQWAPPNRVSLRAYNVAIACDGRQLRARIIDEASQNLDGQVLVRKAPETLSLSDIYVDPLLRDLVGQSAGRFPIQLELLLGENPLAEFLKPDVPRKLLPAADCEGKTCYRVQVSTSEGPFVLWIDRDEYLLRRLEYPASLLAEQLAGAGQITDVRLEVLFRNARFGSQTFDSQFQLEVPSDAKQVQFFVLPPQPLPSNLFGKRPGNFFFTTLDGAQVRQADLNGKTTVLVWFNQFEACRIALEQLEQVYKSAASDQVQFFVVATDPRQMQSDAQLRELLAAWQITVPAVRDLEAFGRDVFRVPFAPTLVVLDAQGRVQIVEVGANPELATQLPLVLDRLQRNEDLAAEILARHEQELKEYERGVAVAQGSAPTETIELPETPLREKREFEHLQLTKLWECKAIDAPGNLMVVQSRDEQPRILVHDGWRSIVELDHQGQVMARHALDLPEGAAISYLRSAVDGQGRRMYLASSLLSSQLHLFDAQWKRLMSYPDPDQPHDGIRDLALQDLDADGQLELYAGFWGLVGVQRISSEGQRVWTNRRANNVLSLAATQPAANGRRQLLIGQDRGILVRVGEDGSEGVPVEITGQPLHHVYTASHPQSATPYCTLNYSAPGALSAVGLDREFNEIWRYELPTGIYRTQLQLAAWGDLLPEVGGQWVFAGADGTLHMVSGRGQLRDLMALGKYVTGFATGRWDNRPVLLVATPESVTAWAVAPRATTARQRRPVF